MISAHNYGCRPETATPPSKLTGWSSVYANLARRAARRECQIVIHYDWKKYACDYIVGVTHRTVIVAGDTSHLVVTCCRGVLWLGAGQLHGYVLSGAALHLRSRAHIDQSHYEPVDGLPWAVHNIDDQQLRRAAERAYLRSKV